MTLLNLIKSRRSIRKFKSDKVSDTNLLELVEAGIYAPSGSNTQCYRFKIITEQKDLTFLGDNKLKWINKAPAVILIVSDNSKCPYLSSKRKAVFDKLPYQDCAMAMQNIVLLAESKGISSCVVHLSESWSTAKGIKEHFKITAYELQGLIVLGYSDEKVNYDTATHATRPIKRKPIQEYLL